MKASHLLAVLLVAWAPAAHAAVCADTTGVSATSVSCDCATTSNETANVTCAIGKYCLTGDIGGVSTGVCMDTHLCLSSSSAPQPDCTCVSPDTNAVSWTANSIVAGIVCNDVTDYNATISTDYRSCNADDVKSKWAGFINDPNCSAAVVALNTTTVEACFMASVAAYLSTPSSSPSDCETCVSATVTAATSNITSVASMDCNKDIPTGSLCPPTINVNTTAGCLKCFELNAADVSACLIPPLGDDDDDDDDHDDHDHDDDTSSGQVVTVSALGVIGAGVASMLAF